MSAATMWKAARDLVAGDVIVFNGIGRAVVLRVPNVPRECRDRRVISYGTFSDGIAQDAPFFPDSQFTVELPAGLTPVQAKADDLLNYARMYLRDTNANSIDITVDERAALMDLLDELDPPNPPTLDELAAQLAWAVRALETYAETGPFTPELNKARDVLKRVPK